MYAAFASVAIKSVAVLGVAWLVTLAMRGRSAAARHLVWIAVAAALLALPVLTVLLPRVEMPGTAALVSAPLFSTTVTAIPTNETTPSAAVHATSSVSKSSAASSVNWRTWILLLWGAGAALGLARMIAGSIALWRARRNAKPSADRALGLELARSLGITRHVDILESRPGSMPMTFGVLRPAVFMPQDAAQWTEERRRVVLFHELAHVSRGDVAAHMFARIAFTLYWWNPLVWSAWREFLKERERATDDLVLSAGTRASDYAGHLLEIARTAAVRPSMGWAAIAMARRSQLEGRLVSILDERVNRGSAKRAGAWIAAAIAIAMVAPLAALRAQDPQSAAIPPDVDAFIRSANAQKNREMLDKAAKAALDVRNYDTAQAFLKSAAQIQADVSGQQSADYAVALIKVGDVEQKRDNDKAAAEFYTKAANILGSRPEALPALMFLGIRSIRQRDFSPAYTYFERAQTADPEHAGRAIMWMAILRRNEQKFDDADALFKNALTLQVPNSIDAAVTLQIYARFLHDRARTTEADDVDVRLAIAKEALKKQVTPVSLPVGTYKIGGNVSQPSLASKVEPEYSEEARMAKFQGSVSLNVVVGVDGVPTDIQVVRPLGLGLDEKAIDAVSKWRFKPGMKDGQPVPVFAVIDVNFRLL